MNIPLGHKLHFNPYMLDTYTFYHVGYSYIHIKYMDTLQSLRDKKNGQQGARFQWLTTSMVVVTAPCSSNFISAPLLTS